MEKGPLYDGNRFLSLDKGRQLMNEGCRDELVFEVLAHDEEHRRLTLALCEKTN